MEQPFSIFLKALKQKQPEAWERLHKVSKTIVEHLAEKDRVELNLAASRNGLSDFDEWFHDVFEEIKENLQVFLNDTIDFNDLKTSISNYAFQKLSGYFHEYLNCLKCKDEKAWSLLNHTLKNQMVFWITQKSGFDREDAKQIYFEGLSLFYEKINDNSLDFDSSRKVKSYLFRIFENKIKELYRSKRKHKQFVTIDSATNANSFFSGAEENSEFVEETAQLIRDRISKLDEVERTILIGCFYSEIKLTQIAKNLGITEENCRVIKYRAIRKIRTKLG